MVIKSSSYLTTLNVFPRAGSGPLSWGEWGKRDGNGAIRDDRGKLVWC